MSDPEALRRYHLVDYLHEHRPTTAEESYQSNNNIGPRCVFGTVIESYKAELLCFSVIYFIEWCVVRNLAEAFYILFT